LGHEPARRASGMNRLDARRDPAYWVPKGGNLAART
jgi:hypothetical protein